MVSIFPHCSWSVVVYDPHLYSILTNLSPSFFLNQSYLSVSKYHPTVNMRRKSNGLFLFSPCKKSLFKTLVLILWNLYVFIFFSPPHIKRTRVAWVWCQNMKIRIKLWFCGDSSLWSEGAAKTIQFESFWFRCWTDRSLSRFQQNLQRCLCSPMGYNGSVNRK